MQRSIEELQGRLKPQNQSEGLTERINEPPWGRCLQGVVDARWVVVVVVCRRRPESPLAEL